MKRILRTCVFLFAASAFGQQPAVPPYPPGSTPPTFPPQVSPRQMPPDTKAPSPERLSNTQIEQQIQDRLKNEPELADTNVSVKSDAKSVQVSGIVDTDYQHDLVLRIAQAYSGDRKIVDKIRVLRRV